MLAAKLLGGVGEEKLYVDDVFSAYTYTGNGSTQTITNGIDLAGKGGLVWLKQRTGANGHNLYNSAQGATNKLATNETNASSVVPTGLTAFSSSGFSLGAFAETNLNASSFVSWTFRKAPKFFDVVTYTGNGAANRSVAHGLGVKPGMVLIKRTNGIGDWYVKHMSFSSNTADFMRLNTTSAKETYTGFWGSTTDDASNFYTGPWDINETGWTYVAYLFAHDSSADGIIQCGSFTTDGSGNATVNLGWEPQFLISRNTNLGSGWDIADSSRKFMVNPPAGPNANARLQADSAGAEAGEVLMYPTATGFKGIAGFTSSTYIYLAIRRPNKPPTSGTQVYNAIARTGTGAAATVTGVGFAPDLSYIKRRTVGSAGFWEDRLRGATIYLMSSTTDGDAIEAQAVTSFGMDGVSVGTSNNVNATDTFINYFFKRAPGVFDQVCYTGTGVNKTETHNLGVVPELWIIKDRDTLVDWGVGCTGLAATEYLALNATDQKQTGATYWNSTYPTASVFSLGTHARINTSTKKYVAYLFATKAGISKVGSYTGNGTSQTINCGFTTGARFILIKRTDSTGDWYVWDTVRGIIAGNDPHLSLNTNVAEVTSDDSIDPAISGFIVNQLAATNINVTSASYVFLAIA